MHAFGEPAVDQDHDRIICEFDDLRRLIDREMFDPQWHEAWALRFLQYTSDHFRREEAVMRRMGFGGLQEHALAHTYLQREFREYLRTLRPGAPNLRASLEVVRRMFLVHILTCDETFGVWQEAARGTAGPTPRPGDQVPIREDLRPHGGSGARPASGSASWPSLVQSSMAAPRANQSGRPRRSGTGWRG